MAPILILLLIVIAVPVLSAVAAELRFQRILDGEAREPRWSEALPPGR